MGRRKSATPAPCSWAGIPPRHWATTAPVPITCCRRHAPRASPRRSGVYDFQKRTSLIQVSADGARKLGAIAAELATGEGLPAHAKAAQYAVAPMSRYWSAVVHGLTPYVPGEQPKLANLVKLNTNENPYGPSPRVLEALRAEMGGYAAAIPRSRQATDLRQAIAARHGVSAGQVFVGNGSDEVLAHAFHGLLKHEAAGVVPRHHLQLLSRVLPSLWHRLSRGTADGIARDQVDDYLRRATAG